MRTVIVTVDPVETVAELQTALARLTGPHDPDVVYLEYDVLHRNDKTGALKLELIENTLTDGSHTYDIRVGQTDK